MQTGVFVQGPLVQPVATQPELARLVHLLETYSSTASLCGAPVTYDHYCDLAWTNWQGHEFCPACYRPLCRECTRLGWASEIEPTLPERA